MFLLFVVTFSWASTAFPEEEEQITQLNHRKYTSFTPEPLRVLNGDTVTNLLVRKGQDIWISTSNKILRFNGKSVDNFSVMGRNKPRYPESQYQSILESSRSEIFLISFDGMIYQTFDSSSEFVRQNDTNDSTLNGAEVMASYIDRNDHIWLGYSDGSVTIYNTKLNVFTQLRPATNSGIVAILESSSHKIFAIDDSGSILIFQNLEAKDFALYDCGQALSPFSIVFVANEFELVLGTRGDGVWRADLSNNICELKKAFAGDPGLINTATVHDISQIEHQQDTLLVISSDSGIYITHKEKVVTELNRTNSTIDTNEVLVARDLGDFGFVVGTYTGVKIFKKTNVELITELPGNKTPSIVAAAYSQKLGTHIADYDHVYRIEKNNSTDDIVEINISSEFGNGIMAMAADNQHLWIGFRNGHLLKYDPEGGTTTEYSSDTSNNRLPPISYMYVSGDNSIFIGTFGGGVYTAREGKIESLSIDKQYPTDKILHIRRLRGIGLVAFSEGGMEILNFDGEDKFLSSERLSRFNDLPIWSVDENETSRWLVTPSTGVYFQELSDDGRINELIQIVPEELLEGHVFYSVHLGRDGVAYLSSNRGIFKAVRNGQFQKLLHGVASDTINFDFGASGVDDRGNVLFGGTGGLARVEPQKEFTTASNPTLRFTKLLANGDLQQLYTTTSNSDLLIEHPAKFLSFEFSVTDFASPEDFKYRYKLHPFDPDYIDGGNEGSATYTNIPPGDYVFRVQGANSVGTWNEDGITMAIRVLPPWWLTWWAYGIYAMGIWLALFVIKQWYDANILRIRADEIARERTLAADSALDEMQDQLEAQDLLVRKIRQRNIANFATLSHIIQHRSDYVPDDISADVMRGSDSHVHALGLLERSLKYYNDILLADLNAFTADCLSKMSVDHVYPNNVTTMNEVTVELLPAEHATLLAIIIHELLDNVYRHAFQNMSGGKYIRVFMSCSQADNDDELTICLKVQDSGIGIPKGVEDDQPGLSLVGEIVEYYNGSLEIDSHNGTAIAIMLSLPCTTDSHGPG